MTHRTLEYEEIIRSHGGRVTPQRVLVLDAICAGNGHTTFGEIFARVKKNDSSLDRTTLYRALDFFIEIGLVVSADMGGETYYEIVKSEPHHHLVCEQCGDTTELPHDMVKMLFHAVEQQIGFVIHTDHLVLVGFCPGCQNNDEG